MTSPIRSVDTQRTGLAPESLEQRIGVEPALVGEAERAAGQVIGAQPGEPVCQLGRRQQVDTHAMLPMHGVVGSSVGEARIGCQEEVAVLDEVDLGRLAIDRRGRRIGFLMTSSPNG